ncbi:hypothetical protein IQ264_03390 [Phormidium sp. LEGE 05292]|uniref:hypothetical protein n=1 Tax=[Phormidium] sp. LEGE 05292 TaxID=767427 RepID=UPI0018824282|nr:hypothetical protein [Phormidium sp. LEGE 05292]MBE9224516.1 hypothetical protein [Phormidium sp. LEGE 05292]
MNHSRRKERRGKREKITVTNQDLVLGVVGAGLADKFGLTAEDFTTKPALTQGLADNFGLTVEYLITKPALTQGLADNFGLTVEYLTIKPAFTQHY